MDPANLTMSAVAAELGVSPSALYRWVADREALLDLVGITMVERIMPASEARSDNWQEWLTEFAYNVRREFAAVPGFAVRILTGPHRQSAHAPLNQAGVQAFTAAGAAPDYAQQCWYAFSIAVLGWTAAEHAGTLPGPIPMDFDVLLRILLCGMNLQPEEPGP